MPPFPNCKLSFAPSSFRIAVFLFALRPPAGRQAGAASQSHRGCVRRMDSILFFDFFHLRTDTFKIQENSTTRFVDGQE
jgi:hypothetical protein